MLIFKIDDECFSVIKTTALYEFTAINFVFCLILFFVAGVFSEEFKYVVILLFLIFHFLFLYFNRNDSGHVTFSVKEGVVELSPLHKRVKNSYPVSGIMGICLVERLIIKDSAEINIINYQMIVYLSSLDGENHRSILSGVSKTPDGLYYAPINMPRVDIHSVRDSLKKYFPENKLNTTECLEFNYAK